MKRKMQAQQGERTANDRSGTVSTRKQRHRPTQRKRHKPARNTQKDKSNIRSNNEGLLSAALALAEAGFDKQTSELTIVGSGATI